MEMALDVELICRKTSVSKEVLSTTNYIFKHMMDEQVGEVKYDEAAQLYYGAPYDESDHPVNLKVLVEADQEHSDLTGSEQ